jgi:hypothetical protein
MVVRGRALKLRWAGAVPLLAAGCAADVEAGTEVQLVSAPAALLAGQRLMTADGGSVTIDELHWTSAEVELIGCRQAWQRAAHFILREAHAHGTASPTLMATPTIESALRAVDLELAALSPPAGQYCSVRYRLAPADGDALGLDAAPQMLGSSFQLRGSLGSTSGESVPFEIASTESFDLVFDIDLSLTERHRAATLRFEHDPERWFRALDVGMLTADTRSRAVLESFKASIRLEVE